MTQSLLMGMYMDGLIEKHGEGRMCNRGGPWFITEKGKRFAEQPTGGEDG